MYNIGVDLGGTNIVVGLVSDSGEIVRKKSIPTLRHRSYQSILKDIALLSLSVIEEAGFKLNDVKSIGIGSPGKCDSKRKVIIYASTFSSFNNINLNNEIQKYIPLPVFLDNDANCAALGEAICGAAKGYENSLTITLGTGIGGGIIINGKIFSGFNFAGGEVGHHTIIIDGEQCGCGRRGCWETYASATALIRQAKIAAIRNPKTKILELVGNAMDNINAKTVFDAADLGDDTAKAVIDDYLKYLSEGLSNMINILQPEIIVIGGGISGQGDKLIMPIVNRLKSSTYSGELETKIAIAALGNDAGIIGAAMLSKQA